MLGIYPYFEQVVAGVYGARGVPNYTGKSCRFGGRPRQERSRFDKNYMRKRARRSEFPLISSGLLMKRQCIASAETAVRKNKYRAGQATATTEILAFDFAQAGMTGKTAETDSSAAPPLRASSPVTPD
jgi:hypothetical protein